MVAATESVLEEMEGGESGGTGHAAEVPDADTEEFTDLDLALFAEQSRLRHIGHKGNNNCVASWARFVSLDKAYSSVEFFDSEVSLGRSDVVTADEEKNMHVSKVHCKIWQNGDDGSCHLRNLSVNGTLVQGTAVEKEQQVPLHHGDEVSLGPQDSGCPRFIFQLLDRVKHEQQSRGTEETLVADDTGDVNDDEPDPKRVKIINSDETFKCSICLNVWLDVVSVTPCLHSFCNPCFSNWYRKSCKERTECRCPQCRGVVTSVGRNHTLRNLVQDLLKENPSLSRSPEEAVELEKSSLFTNGSETKFQFGRHRSNWLSTGDEVDPPSWSDDDALSSDEQYEASVDGLDADTCTQCLTQDGMDNFQCPSGQTHMRCGSCSRLYPERSDVENVVQRCSVCTIPYCATYFASQHIPPVDFHRCPDILPLFQRRVTDMPSTTHNGNAYEQEVTRQYLVEHGLSVQGVLTDWLRKLDTGEADQPRFCSSRISSATALCDYCTQKVFAHLLDMFRVMVPKSELPPAAAGREDCWYGNACRTQHHNESHARKRNHVCEPSHQTNRGRVNAVQM